MIEELAERSRGRRAGGGLGPEHAAVHRSARRQNSYFLQRARERCVPHLRATIQPFGLDGMNLTGQVARYEARLDPQTRNMRTEIDVPNPRGNCTQACTPRCRSRRRSTASHSKFLLRRSVPTRPDHTCRWCGRVELRVKPSRRESHKAHWSNSYPVLARTPTASRQSRAPRRRAHPSMRRALDFNTRVRSVLPNANFLAGMPIGLWITPPEITTDASRIGTSLTRWCLSVLVCARAQLFLI
jgi:hypothetical protein